MLHEYIGFNERCVLVQPFQRPKPPYDQLAQGQLTSQTLTRVYLSIWPSPILFPCSLKPSLQEVHNGANDTQPLLSYEGHGCSTAENAETRSSAVPQKEAERTTCQAVWPICLPEDTSLIFTHTKLNNSYLITVYIHKNIPPQTRWVKPGIQHASTAT